MRYRIDTDPFEKKQPPIEFMEELTGPVHTGKPCYWNKRDAHDNEVFIDGAFVLAEFPDSDGVLDTAYEDLKKFLKISEVKDGSFCFKTAINKVMTEEAYRITVNETECLIESADTEGIRRAIFYIEDEMNRREGSFLPMGVIFRYAAIKRRISRGFLNPHYCPDSDGELSDDTEYYTDDYLNRLAHDGVNGIWVQERVRVLIESEIIPEYGKNGEARLNRLNRLIEKCKRYGIKVYLEGIEPASTFQNPALFNHPELLGQGFAESHHAFCSSTQKGRAYIKESITALFRVAPGLAGMINISAGEAISCCASLDEDIECPACKATGLTKVQILARCEEDIADAMHSVNPDAELISWAYAMRGWKESDAAEYFNVRSAKSASMINFEDLGEPEQLGKKRLAADYWLSYAGPGKLFKRAAETGAKRGTPVYAKIQACSSHEVSSVPYVPVPGILYEKFKYMHEHNVSGAMYCWYFGNYPSMMNKAAGELAFAPFFENKDDFLEHLSGIYWGSDAKFAANAYNCFEEGYKNYPVSTTFEWHGPMGDAPVWPLHLEPVDLPVSRSYKLMNMVGSDRMGETMLMSHTYSEILALLNIMSKKWTKGTQIISKLDAKDDYKRAEQQWVSSALDILFKSGSNIFKFYDLRSKLAFFSEDKKDILEKMREIVLEEIEHSKKLEKLCIKDKRLGYHCEAIGFKFFPEKLRWRIQLLEELLKTEFPMVLKRIENGMLPLPFCFGLGEDSHRYIARKDSEWEDMQARNGKNTKAKIRVRETEDAFIVEVKNSDSGEIKIKPEFEMFHPYITVMIKENGEPYFVSAQSYGLYGENLKKELEKWKIYKNADGEETIYTVVLKKADFFTGEQIPPFRLAVSIEGEKASDWEKGDRFFHRLIFGNFSPDSYVFIVPENLAELQ